MAHIIIAGSVLPDGNLQFGDRTEFKSGKEKTGVYTITFIKPYPNTPVIVATSDGGERGCRIDIKNVNSVTCKLESRSYDTNALCDSGFNFIALL